MLEAIRGARRTITFETYIYLSGSIGEQFAEALSERARAGVEVHVLLDRAGPRLCAAADPNVFTLEEWRNRPWRERIVERILGLARSQT